MSILQKQVVQFLKTETTQHQFAIANRVKRTDEYKKENRWYRIYIVVWSNSGSAYIISKGKRLFLENETITTQSENIEWEANL